MSSRSGTCLPPSSSLPPVRSLLAASEEQVTSALRALQTLYCPLRLPTLPKASIRRKDLSAVSGVSTPVPVDSGYVSQDEDEDDDESGASDTTSAIRADPFERTFATRWLTSLISRAEEMDLSEDSRAQIVDDAAFILSSFSDSSSSPEEESLTRDFSFPTPCGPDIKVTLNDAPLTGADHTDVGLQSWGASIVLSSMMCEDPARFGLPSLSAPSVLELGAGTGLISLTLAHLLPQLAVHPASLTATDYHPTVLANLHSNILTNFPEASHSRTSPPTAAPLDWASPPAHLAHTADLLIAADVVYAPQHAAWLRDCAAHLSSPRAVFWLIVTVRQTGKFEGIADTVEDAFRLDSCPRDERGRVFCITDKTVLQKRRGVGRGDEVAYHLYRIAWC